METAMEFGAKNSLTKLGVRLIGIFFFIRAVADVYGLITHTRSAEGFLGFYMNFNDDGKPIIDIMAWVGVVIMIYVCFQLFRFHPSGRNWALTIYWLLLLEGAGYSIWLIISWVKDFFGGKDFSFALNINNPVWQGEVSGLFAILLYFGVVVVFIFIPVYFLMRKDVKQLFQKTAPTGETN